MSKSIQVGPNPRLITGSSTAIPDGYVALTPDVSNNVTVDLSLGRNFALLLDSTMQDTSIPPVSLLTFLAPIKSVGTIAPGDAFYLYIGQDSLGDHPPPAFSTGVGGFSAKTNSDAAGIGGDVDEWTYFQFTRHGSKWSLDIPPSPGISLT